MSTNSTAAAVMNDIRDIKPPVVIPNYWWLLWVGIALLVLLIALFIWWRIWLKQKSRMIEPPKIPAHIRAKLRLQEALEFITQPKPFCILVSDTARMYLEERFTFHAPERTTEEFLRELQDTDLLAKEQKEKLGEFLEQCDLVKFAKYEPGENELKNLHGSALRLVEETEISEEQPLPAISVTAGKPVEATRPAAVGKLNGKVLAIVGVFLQLVPVVWAAVFVFSFIRRIELMASTSGDAANLKSEEVTRMATELMREQLTLIIIGGLVGLIGLVLILISLTTKRYRAKWFFWFLIIYGLVLVCGFPVGTVLGGFFIVYCLMKRQEFFSKA
jgi:hypothetical protein